MFRKSVRFPLACCMGLFCCWLNSVQAESPVTPETTIIDAAISVYQTQFQEARQSGQWPSAEQRGEMVDQALTGIDPATLSLDELDALTASVPIVYGSQADAYDAQLTNFAEQQTTEGARAAALRFRLMGRDTIQEDRAEAVRDLFSHPGLAEAWQQGQAMDVFNSFYFLDKDALKSLHVDFVSLEPIVDAKMPVAFFNRMAGAFFAMANIDDTESSQARESLRLALVSAIDEKLKDETLDEEQTKQLTDARGRLDGAYAKGELLDHTAPELHFSWWSNPSDADESFSKLSDLKGKVVVLDFWATWCGPCVGSFPNVKELQKHYEGYDVMIVGVTSLQGAHYPGDGRDKIDTSNEPEKEMALMKEFMESKGVTWRVAFAEEPVFNPDYGVNGIPHVVILDTKGVVRFRGLHPAMPEAQKTSKIDLLLTEAGKPVPTSEEKSEEGTN